jgi:putative transposase
MEEEIPRDKINHDHLPRLNDSAYRGNAIVHWTMAIHNRGVGWLNARFTARFCWLLLHGCARYSLACPIYCLMPDHVHLLLHGWSQQGDQRGFIRFLRRHTNNLLVDTGHRWQSQAFDHVLRPNESDIHAYETLVHYIAQNPVRKGLADHPQEWPHTGAVIPGYPELKLWEQNFWPSYWRIRKSLATS